MIRYLKLIDVLELHKFVMQQTNSEPQPLRDLGLLESAVMRPQMSAYYEQSDLIHQAGLLAIGISQAQAFLDGNKRTALVSLHFFLKRNRAFYIGDSLELAKQLENVAVRSHELEEATNDFTQWLRQNVTLSE